MNALKLTFVILVFCVSLATFVEASEDEDDVSSYKQFIERNVMYIWNVHMNPKSEMALICKISSKRNTTTMKRALRGNLCVCVCVCMFRVCGCVCVGLVVYGGVWFRMAAYVRVSVYVYVNGNVAKWVQPYKWSVLTLDIITFYLFQTSLSLEKRELL
jgi:hypothetical protein